MLGCGIFQEKIPYKVALVCSCDSCDMLTYISTGQARTKSAPAVEILSRRSCQETSSREPGQRFHKEILYRDIAWRSFEILLAGLLQRSCQETSYRDLVHRSCQDTSYGDLVQRHCGRDPVAEILPRGLLHKSCQERFYRELVQRSQKEILPRDLL